VKDPQITVLMPVRDGARWLRQAIDSVLGQSLQGFELLVVDDGSVDETPAILASYAPDRRMRVIRGARAGLVAALNRGIADAAAPLIARLDADDSALPQRLARQAEYMRAHPGAELLGSWAEIVDEAGQPAGAMRRPTDNDELARALDRENPFIHSSVVFRTATVRSLGGYRAPFAAAEDYDLWTRLSEAGDVANLGEALVRYRVHGGGVTRLQSVRQVFSVRMVRRARAARRETGQDPAAALSTPPDLFAPETDAAFYAEDAQICRFLALSEQEAVTPAHLARVDFDAFQRSIGSLTRAERRLAQLATVNLITARDLRLPVARSALTRLLFRLHPGHALGYVPRLLSRRPAAHRAA
jgi:glycosyltransferase involved in cell wall biosynthesis